MDRVRTRSTRALRIKKFDIRGTHNARDELRAGKKYRLILSSEGALYAEIMSYLKSDLCLPISRVVSSHASHFFKFYLGASASITPLSHPKSWGHTHIKQFRKMMLNIYQGEKLKGKKSL